MRSSICFFVLLMLGYSNQMYSQSLKLKELPIGVGYYGDNALHPGLKVGTYYTILSKEKSKNYRLNYRQNKYGNKRKLKELNMDLNLGFYSFSNNHLGVFTNTGLTYLRTKLRKGRQFGLSFEIGYLRRFNKLTTYELSNEGEISEVKFAGTNAIMFSLSPVFGKQFKFNDKTLRYYVKPSVQLITYNEKLQPNASLELGMVFNLNK